MPYEDGARTLFLYTKGTKGNPPEELRDLLRYMEYTNAQNATNHDLQEIHSMIETVKYDAGVTGDYMRLMEDEDVILERGIRQGIQLGRQEGRQEGKQEGVLLGTRQNIIKFLEARFLISEVIKEKISTQQDLDVLDTWLQYAAKVTSPEEFLEKISNN